MPTKKIYLQGEAGGYFYDRNGKIGAFEKISGFNLSFQSGYLVNEEEDLYIGFEYKLKNQDFNYIDTNYYINQPIYPKVYKTAQVFNVIGSKHIYWKHLYVDLTLGLGVRFTNISNSEGDYETKVWRDSMSFIAMEHGKRILPSISFNTRIGWILF